MVTLLIDVSQNLNLVFFLPAFKHILLLDYNITMKEKSFNNGEGLLVTLRPEYIQHLTSCGRKLQTLFYRCGGSEDMGI